MAGNEAMIEAWPLPFTGLGSAEAPEDAGFHAAARRGELAMQACGSCGRLRFPPRPMCPACRSLRREWRQLSARGHIWSYTVPHPPLLPAFNELAPYPVIVVELDATPGIRLVGNLVAHAGAPINSVDPETIRIGEPVRAVFAPMTDDVTLVRWVRLEAPR
jgi:uncharacterized OB-fold protein